MNPEIHYTVANNMKLGHDDIYTCYRDVESQPENKEEKLFCHQLSIKKNVVFFIRKLKVREVSIVT